MIWDQVHVARIANSYVVATIFFHLCDNDSAMKDIGRI